MKKIGWGIIGPGAIFKRLMNDLAYCKDASLAAVSSRSLKRAQDAAKEYGFKRAYGSYEEIINDRDVDVIYVATPHPFHKEQVLMCLNAGKAVLCEKPIGVNLKETREMVDCAKKNNVFFMEAMWTRHFPVNKKIKEIISSGTIGKPILMNIDFCFGSWDNRNNFDKNTRLFSPALAGGSLMDVGIYCISYITWMFDKQPDEIYAAAEKLSTGVDGICAGMLKYADGEIASFKSSIIQSTKHKAEIYCENADITVDDFWHPTKAIISYKDDREDLILEDNYGIDGRKGFNYEINHVIKCMNNGLYESPYMTWQDSIDVMETMDAIRNKIGLKYPFE